MPSFLETSYLLIYGELPTRDQLDDFRYGIRKHTLLHEDAKRFFDAFPKDAHPMGVLSSVVERAVDLLPRQQRPPRREAGAAVDHPHHGEAADDRGVLLQALDRPAVPLPEQQPRSDRELPHDDVRGAVGALRGQPDDRARDEAAAHPPRRPRAELLHVDRAPRRLDRREPLRVDRGGDQRTVGPAARRREPGRHRDARTHPRRRRRHRASTSARPRTRTTRSASRASVTASTRTTTRAPASSRSRPTGARRSSARPTS